MKTTNHLVHRRTRTSGILEHNKAVRSQGDLRSFPARPIPDQSTIFRRLLLTSTSLIVVAILSGCVSALDIKQTDANLKGASTYLAVKEVRESQERMVEARTEMLTRDRVFWGGVTVVGGESGAPELPACSDPSVVGQFQATVTERLRGVNPPYFDLQGIGGGGADNWKDQDGLIMVVALASENRFCQPDSVLEGKYRAVIKITGQILFIDAKANMQVTACYPLGVAQMGFFKEKPSEKDFVDLAKMALLSKERTDDNRPLSLLDQLLDQLAGRTVVPRALRPPITVGAVTFLPACQQGKLPTGVQSLPTEILTRWSSQFAHSFVNYLGSGNGLSVNPYTYGGESGVAKNEVLNKAAVLTMRTTDHKLLNAQLRPPRMVFNLEFQQLYCTESRKSSLYLSVWDYGFRGRLDVVLPDVKTTNLLSLAFQIPVAAGTKLPKDLQEKYSEVSGTKLLKETIEKGQVDNAYWWQQSIDQYLLQIAREIAHEGQDSAHKFGNVREQLKSSLNP